MQKIIKTTQTTLLLGPHFKGIPAKFKTNFLIINTRKPFTIAMKNNISLFLLFCLFILRGPSLLAQPLNDNCEGATNIANPRDFCLEATSTGATASGYGGNNCLTAGANDVWFTFTALATTVTITVSSQSAGTPNYTLRNAQAVLYYGTCGGTLNDLGCANASATTSGTLDITKGGMIVGEPYLIRIQGANNTTGSFKLCIKNYNPPAFIDSDCPTGSVLCDKSPFNVKFLTGSGRIPDEFSDAPCLAFPGTNSESSSAWFKWTCQTSGPLTLKITPNFVGDGRTPSSSGQGIGDDIDFAVYELPNGLNNCTGKSILRCMGAGPYPTCSLTEQLRCWGATGLRDGSTDITEPGGCSCGTDHDNFVAPINMVAGKVYALGINNFSNTGNGFSLEFGGTGTFVGPEAKITNNVPSKKICLGEDIVFGDASTFANGQITKRQWRFGKGASIDTASGNGPYRIFYKTPGLKSIVLTVTTDRGCQVTTILDSILVEPFKYDSASRRPTCTRGNDGMLRLKVISCGRPPIRYNWENTGYTTRDSFSGLRTGTYRVAVTDSSGIYVDTIRFTLKEQTIELDTAVRAVKPPTCFGLTNGSITLKPSTGVGPYIYNWGRGTTLDSTFTALGEGTYTVSVVDANACKGNFVFDIVAPPKVEVSLDTFNISCFGLTDGQAVAHPSGGVGNYRVSWENGALGDTVRNLKAGTYRCFVFDSNGCPGITNVLIREPPQIFLNPSRIKSALCYGDSTAELVVLGSGGTPPYRYSIDGVRFQRDSAFLKIPARNYQVVVRDITGCRATFMVSVPQPPLLQVNAGSDVEIDLGESATLRAIVVPSSKQVSYAWTPADTTISCKNCPVVTVLPLKTTTYRVFVKDSQNCTAFDDVLLRVIKRRPVYAPNVFSPNNDGVNDFFTLYGNQASVKIQSLKVFNRWGDMMYSGINLPLGAERTGWDGTFGGRDVPPDVFVYVAVVSFIDGEEIIVKGDVTLTR
jgi:gliding motility-associated-like protein